MIDLKAIRERRMLETNDRRPWAFESPYRADGGRVLDCTGYIVCDGHWLDMEELAAQLNDRAALLAEVDRLKGLCGRAALNLGLPRHEDSALIAELRESSK